MNMLSDPFMQSAIIPFIVSVAVGLVIYRISPAWTSLAIIPGFFMAAALIQGIDLFPLTSTRKILFLGLLTPILGLLVKFRLRHTTVQLAILITSVVLMSLWVLWPVLVRKEMIDALMLAGGVSVFVAWTLVSLRTLTAEPHRFSVAAMMMAIAGGIAAALSASAMLGQLISSLAAAVAGFILLLLILRRIELHHTVVIMCGVLIALLVSAAMVYAQLPAGSIWALAVIPVLVRTPVSASAAGWKQMVMMVLVSLPAVVMSVYIAWQAAPVSMY